VLGALTSLGPGDIRYSVAVSEVIMNRIAAARMRRQLEARASRDPEWTALLDRVISREIDPATAAASSVYDGTTVYFCSTSCKAEFDTGHGSI